MQRLAEVVKPAQVDRVLTFLHERAGGKVTPQMLALALRARTIARWCKASDDDLAKLDLIVNSVEGHREKKRGMTAKNRALLDRLEDQRFADHVQLLPLFLLERATKRQASRRSAALARTAMAIELLLVCSVRRANLVSLELGKSIKQIGEGKDTRWIIECDSEEVKNNQHLRFTLKAPTAAMLEMYLREWRPQLCNKPNPWLFPAADGKCIDPKTMAHAITTQSKRIHRELLLRLVVRVDALRLGFAGASLTLEALSFEASIIEPHRWILPDEHLGLLPLHPDAGEEELLAILLHAKEERGAILAEIVEAFG